MEIRTEDGEGWCPLELKGFQGSCSSHFTKAQCGTVLAIPTCFEVRANPDIEADLTIKCAIVISFFKLFLSQRPLNTLVFPARLRGEQEDFNIGLFLDLPKISVRISQVCISAQSHWNGLVTKGRGVLIVIQCNWYKLGVWGISAVSDLGREFPSVRYLSSEGDQAWSFGSHGAECRTEKEWECLNQTTLVSEGEIPVCLHMLLKWGANENLVLLQQKEKFPLCSTRLGFHPRPPHYSKTLM